MSNHVKTSPKDPHAKAVTSDSNVDRKSSTNHPPDLPRWASEWKPVWELVLNRFKIKRNQPASIEACLAVLKQLQTDVAIPNHVNETMLLVDQHFTLNITAEEFDKFHGCSDSEIAYKELLKQEIATCEANMAQAASHCTVFDRIQDFVEELKAYLRYVKGSRDTEVTAQCLFQAFAALVKLRFRPGVVQKKKYASFERQDGKDDPIVVCSSPGLRAVVNDPLNWQGCVAERVLCIAEVMKERDNRDKRMAFTCSGETEKHTALSVSEKFIGQLTAEVLVERHASVFSDNSKIQMMAFAVQGTQVQMFVFDICEYHLAAPRERGPHSAAHGGPGPSLLHTSTVYDILLKEDRRHLLQAMAKLAAYHL